MKSLSESEMNFAEMIWENEPVPSGQLVKMCAQKYEWKKSTTYTVLKHLCEYGYFQNQDAVVTSLVSREEYLEKESSRFVEEKFQGSLSKFLTAFAGGKRLSEKQVKEIRDMIEGFEE